MTPLDFAVMAAYFLVVWGIGAWFGRRQHGAGDYFLGHRSLPWWAVMLSIVATETSALTVISVPGIAARGNLTFLQIPIGYLIGRIGVAWWLLPGYFAGAQETAYERLASRFGPLTRRTAAALFMVIRALGDSVRVFATAIPLMVVTGWNMPACILAVVGVTLVYTLRGGLSAVVWVDVLQMGLYVLGGVLVIGAAALLTGGLGVAVERAWEAGKLAAFDFRFSFTAPYTFVAAVVGGALLSAASHGTDHLIVQRLLATKSLAHARRALVGSGVLVIAQFALFLFAGTMLWAAGAADDLAMRGDRIYPEFVVRALGSGLTGLVIAGLLAAAMSTVSSSLNALASASTYDFYATLTGRRDPAHLLRVGRWFTVLWSLVLGGGALAFRSDDQPVVVLALAIASITYGGLLGTYILGGVARMRQRDAITGMSVSVAAMLVVVFAKPGPFADLGWPWYVPLGLAITLMAGWTASWLGRTA